MGKLVRLDELHDALRYAKAEEERAGKLLSSGDIRYRMYLEFRQRVEDIEGEIERLES